MVKTIQTEIYAEQDKTNRRTVTLWVDEGLSVQTCGYGLSPDDARKLADELRAAADEADVG